MTRLTGPQVQVLTSAWYDRVFQRTKAGELYSWNTMTNSLCTKQTKALEKLGLLKVVPLPEGSGLESRLFVPTVDGEDMLKKMGIIDDD